MHSTLTTSFPAPQVVGMDADEEGRPLLIDDEDDENHLEQTDHFEAAYNFRCGGGGRGCCCWHGARRSIYLLLRVVSSGPCGGRGLAAEKPLLLSSPSGSAQLGWDTCGQSESRLNMEQQVFDPSCLTSNACMRCCNPTNAGLRSLAHPKSLAIRVWWRAPCVRRTTGKPACVCLELGWQR